MSLEFPDQRLARVISEAAFNPAKWVDVCDGLARVTSADGGLVIPVDMVQRSMWLPHSKALDELVSSYQEEEWYKVDIRTRGVPAMLRRGYTTDADSIAHDEIPHSDFYQDLLRPAGFLWFAGFGFQSEGSICAMTIQRNLHSEPFSEEEIGRALAYRELLTNSATIAKQLGFARIDGASSVLEQQGFCAIALDAGERVVHVSPSAEFHLHDGLQVSGGRLHARLAADAPALTRLIRGICGKDAAASQRHVSLSRSGGKPPLVLYGCALPEAQCDVFQPAVGLLVISDPQRPQDIPPALLIDYFGLTPAEAGLAVALLRGTSVEHYAGDHRTSPATVRNQLQSLLRKTSTHHRGELIAALNRVVPCK